MIQSEKLAARFYKERRIFGILAPDNTKRGDKT